MAEDLLRILTLCLSVFAFELGRLLFVKRREWWGIPISIFALISGVLAYTAR